jgi:hypothetical protein
MASLPKRFLAGSSGQVDQPAQATLETANRVLADRRDTEPFAGRAKGLLTVMSRRSRPRRWDTDTPTLGFGSPTPVGHKSCSTCPRSSTPRGYEIQ